MLSATLIFPHQLFKQHPALIQKSAVYLVEEWLFFKQYNFHKQKITLHRASMQFYKHYLQQQKQTVHYIESSHKQSDCRVLIEALHKQGITEIHVATLVDNWLYSRLENACNTYQIKLCIHETPNFLNSLQSVAPFFNDKKKYHQTDFYTWQRKQRNILLEDNGKPLGGKWTFDADNRQKFPKKETAPSLHIPAENEYIREAKIYVQKHFAHNIGNITKPGLFVVTFNDAEAWLQDFLENRFEKFGIYEDAIVRNENVLYHSVLTPMLNIGLLNPQQILDAALKVAAKKNIPLNSLEGFVRQILGWREFIRIVYEREGTKQRTTNYWKFTRKIPASFYTGTTGIAPIDDTIKKILETGYCHHIERLMVLGNFMLLCEFDPNEVHRWFMELFIDSYDWVMVPNVYGMTQFADGGIMTTKPYISGSNYLMKMSDYSKDSWQPIWDGLFWRFMHMHRTFFLKNPRLGMLIGSFDKMETTKRNMHLDTANLFLNNLDNLVNA
jgi:deoxyribodipyrimidine photolyase-related protein